VPKHDLNYKAGYKEVLRNPVAVRLLTAKLISGLGDFIGLAALLLLAFDSSDSVLGPVGVYTARSLPALLVMTVFSNWLDRPPRRAALSVLSLLGGVTVAAPAATPTTTAAIAAAAVLGGLRTAQQSTEAALIAESVDQPLRLGLYGLAGTIDQACQTAGLLAGSIVSLAMGTRVALWVDVVSFVLAALIFISLPASKHIARGPRPARTEGLRIIWREPTLQALIFLVWASALNGPMPEALAPSLAHGAWLPVVMASSPIGGMVFIFAAGRSRLLSGVDNQIRMVYGLGASLLLGALVLAMGLPIIFLVIANAAIGAGFGWIFGAQATFARLVPQERMGQVEGTVVASNILARGIGTFLVGVIVQATHPSMAYLVGGLAVIGCAVLVSRRQRTEMSRISDEKTGAASRGSP
jgi:MFS family permease